MGITEKNNADGVIYGYCQCECKSDECICLINACNSPSEEEARTKWEKNFQSIWNLKPFDPDKEDVKSEKNESDKGKDTGKDVKREKIESDQGESADKKDIGRFANASAIDVHPYFEPIEEMDPYLLRSIVEECNHFDQAFIDPKLFNGCCFGETIFSQPPLLSSMVVDVYKRTNDIDLVKKALSALVKEHKFWNSGIHDVTIEDDQGLTHNLSRYYAMWNQPRPESFTINKDFDINLFVSHDTETADKLTNDCEKEKFYRELASTAETGWDFSTRWMKNISDLATLTTTTIVPVDLNAFVLKLLEATLFYVVLDLAYQITIFFDKENCKPNTTKTKTPSGRNAAGRRHTCLYISYNGQLQTHSSPAHNKQNQNLKG
ncbi:trehalase [Artemisia annua]|uniref:Trehalase n=1 Tax=Artemisia annua TaxID=35608 RepID=A0A2U1LY60_ARTAN|nr:trehalase [Artemisia annua]